MRALGVQLSSSLALKLDVPLYGQLTMPLSGSSKLFVPAFMIQDVLLLEGIARWTISWYLAIVQDDGNSVELRVVFEVSSLHFPLTMS